MSAHIGAIKSVNDFIGKVFQQPKGNFADRLNTRITVCILSLSSAILLSGHFFGDPITCWTPAQFTKQWSDFVNQYCYVHGTYFVPFDEGLSHDDDERKKVPINYYQWVPYILALQAFCFYMPRFVWKGLCSFSGYDLAGSIRYVDQVWTEVKNKDDTFKTRLAYFEGRPACYIWEALRITRTKQRKFHVDLSLCYTIGTVLQTLNAWLQFCLLNEVIGSRLYSWWGPNMLTDLASGNDWQSTGHFPRITHCDFNRRRPASVQLDTVLCVLSLNIYYEKIFLFLWFWLLMVAVVSTGNTMMWIVQWTVSSKARENVECYLKTDPSDKTGMDRVKFYRNLGPDGLFVLQQMGQNLGDLPASYLTIAMRSIAHRYEDENESNRAIQERLKSDEHRSLLGPGPVKV